MSLRERMRQALREAMRARDRVAVGALRTTLAALDNAEAVPVPSAASAGAALEQLPVGAGATDVARRELSEIEIADLVRAEIAERHEAAAAPNGPASRAAKLRAEAALLERFLEDPSTG